MRSCHDESRRRKRSLPQIGRDSYPEPVAPDDFERFFDRDQIERGFAELSIDHRVVLVLRYLLDLPLDAIADALDIPIGTVDSRLHRAIKQMRTALEAASQPARVMPQRATR